MHSPCDRFCDVRESSRTEVWSFAMQPANGCSWWLLWLRLNCLIALPDKLRYHVVGGVGLAPGRGGRVKQRVLIRSPSPETPWRGAHRNLRPAPYRRPSD